MPDWTNYLTESEQCQLDEITIELIKNRADRRQLMNRAKQRKHRKTQRSN